MPKVFKMPGYNFEADLGRFARQADGSVWLRAGNNVILATVVASKSKPSGSQGFFPLTVEYRERMASVGKIPGGFIKREGRLSDSEVLSSRIVDRSIRPLFPKFFLQETQVMLSLLSYDGKVPQRVLGVLAASIALTTSKLPFGGPVGAVVCARQDKGEWKVNPSIEFLKGAQDQVLVVGTEVGICMVEAECDFVSDDELIDLVQGLAFTEIKKQVAWQREIGAEYSEKMTGYEVDGLNADAVKEWSKKIESSLPENHKELFFADDKVTLDDNMKLIRTTIKEKLEQDIVDAGLGEAAVDLLIDTFLKKFVPNVLLSEGKRFDFRKFDQIRQIEGIVDLLPQAHGSAVFTRGQTQALATLTLGASGDSQRVETLFDGVIDKRFMLHYNFPPYSTGEVKMLRGVGRREIGHGYLAEKSFTNVLPDFKKFPYAIRSLVDVLESNGSSSMATVCATMLAFMDAGVPTKRIVAGIAMGLLQDAKGDFAVISDITGTEDAYGLMDLKLVGDESGISAIQIDVKSDTGLSSETFKNALKQSRVGIKHILGEMKKCLAAPRVQLKDNAPRCFTMKVDSSKLGLIIGPGGKNIKLITAETNTQVDLDDDGTVSIFASDGSSAKAAENWIKALIGDIRTGSAFQGKVSKIADFGIFVSLVPGKDGLIHVSTIDRSKKNRLEELYKPGDSIGVVVTAVDGDGRVKLVAPELEASDESLD